MNQPSVLLDHSFLVAISDLDDPNHDAAVDVYRSLIDDFVAERCLLVARADHLQLALELQANLDLFASIDKLHIARQHRNAAAEMAARSGIDLDEAITLVLIHRHRIRTVHSFDERFAGFDADSKVVVPNYVPAGTVAAPEATRLASEAS